MVLQHASPLLDEIGLELPKLTLDEHCRYLILAPDTEAVPMPSCKSSDVVSAVSISDPSRMI